MRNYRIEITGPTEATVEFEADENQAFERLNTYRELFMNATVTLWKQGENAMDDRAELVF